MRDRSAAETGRAKHDHDHFTKKINTTGVMECQRLKHTGVRRNDFP
jgi:hypothetical protein